MTGFCFRWSVWTAQVLTTPERYYTVYHTITLAMFWMWIPVFRVSFPLLDRRLSLQGCDLPNNDHSVNVQLLCSSMAKLTSLMNLVVGIKKWQTAAPTFQLMLRRSKKAVTCSFSSVTQQITCYGGCSIWAYSFLGGPQFAGSGTIVKLYNY